jgi:molybdopterin-guanine dinucleotide biosynthesis protein A
MSDRQQATGVSAAILAGGRARRLGGRDKASLVVGGVSVLEHQVRVLTEVTDRVVIVGGRGETCQASGLRLVADVWPDAGPLGGIYTALLETACDRVLIVACDMPFLHPAFLNYLVACSPGVDAVVPRGLDGLHPLCAVYSRAATAAVRGRLESGRRKVADLLDDLRVREVGPEEMAAHDPDGLLLFNVNTPKDYQRARMRRRPARPGWFPVR